MYLYVSSNPYMSFFLSQCGCDLDSLSLKKILLLLSYLNPNNFFYYFGPHPSRLHFHGVTWDSFTPDSYIHHIRLLSSLVTFSLDFHLPNFSLVQCGVNCLFNLSVLVELLVISVECCTFKPLNLHMLIP
jgi:hypothetical protein